MFAPKPSRQRTLDAIDHRVPTAEKVLVAEKVRRLTTAPGRLAAAGRLPLGRAYLVITDRSLWLIRRGQFDHVGHEIAHLPIASMRSLETEQPKRLTLHFGDGSAWTLELSNRSVMPYLQSLRPWVELTHRRGETATA